MENLKPKLKLQMGKESEILRSEESTPLDLALPLYLKTMKNTILVDYLEQKMKERDELFFKRLRK